MPRQSRPSLAIAALAVSLLASTVSPPRASAQIFVGTGASAVAMPGGEQAATPPVVAPPVSPPPRETLRFLPNTLDGLRLSGEAGDLRWPVYLTAAQAAAPARFRVGYLSAVSLLPDASVLEVKINDVSVGTDVIDASRGLRTIAFAVPAELLRPGFNAISISVDQRHRVDCSVAATYELWTRLDPGETGLVLQPGARTITDLADLAGLLPRADGTLPIHVVLAGKTTPRHVGQLIETTQRIALAAHALQPAVDFTPTIDDPYGVDLLVGPREALRHLSRVVDLVGSDGPLARIVPAAGEGRPMLLVTGADDAEIEQAIARIAPQAAPVGTSAGLLALANYPAMAIAGAGRLKLRDLGVRSQDFSGRFFRKSFNLAMPADFLASDYGRGTFDLAGGYAAGLTRDAQVRVDVNGRSSGIIKLPSSSGEVFQHNPLFLPLSLMRPGLNRIDVFAETPRPDDATCAASEAKRFLFLDSSELVLPPLARVERLPDLALATSGGMPYGRGHSHLVVPKPDRETMGAALSLTARAAVAAGAAIPFDFATKAGTGESGSTLVVSPVRDLDPALMRDIGLDPQAVEAAWQGRTVAPVASETSPPSGRRWWLTRADGPSACRLPSLAGAPRSGSTIAATVPSPSARSPAASDSDIMLEAWSSEARAAPGWRDGLAALPGTLATWFDHATASARAIVQPEHAMAIDPASSLILAQGMSPGSRENVTTIVTALDAPTLRGSVACLFDPQVWAKVHGRLAMLDGSSGEVTATDATSFHYIASDRTPIGNARLVVAGWFSLNPLAFVAFALLTALCLGGTTLWFVRGVGRRPE